MKATLRALLASLATGIVAFAIAFAWAQHQLAIRLQQQRAGFAGGFVPVPLWPVFILMAVVFAVMFHRSRRSQ